MTVKDIVKIIFSQYILLSINLFLLPNLERLTGGSCQLFSTSTESETDSPLFIQRGGVLGSFASRVGKKKDKTVIIWVDLRYERVKMKYNILSILSTLNAEWMKDTLTRLRNTDTSCEEFIMTFTTVFLLMIIGVTCGNFQIV